MKAQPTTLTPQHLLLGESLPGFAPALSLALGLLFVFGSFALLHTRTKAHQHAQSAPPPQRTKHQTNLAQRESPHNLAPQLQARPQTPKAAATVQTIAFSSTARGTQSPPKRAPATAPGATNNTLAPAQQADCPPRFTVQFASNQKLTPTHYHKKLRTLRRWLRRHPAVSLVIQGHSDSVGPAQYNWALSHQRARNVAALLRRYGLSPKRITVRAVGEYQPLIGVRDRDGKNRRVSFLLVGASRCPGNIPKRKTS